MGAVIHSLTQISWPRCLRIGTLKPQRARAPSAGSARIPQRQRSTSDSLFSWQCARWFWRTSPFSTLPFLARAKHRCLALLGPGLQAVSVKELSASQPERRRALAERWPSTHRPWLCWHTFHCIDLTLDFLTLSHLTLPKIPALFSSATMIFHDVHQTIPTSHHITSHTTALLICPVPRGGGWLEARRFGTRRDVRVAPISLPRAGFGCSTCPPGTFDRSLGSGHTHCSHCLQRAEHDARVG